MKSGFEDNVPKVQPRVRLGRAPEDTGFGGRRVYPGVAVR